MNYHFRLTIILILLTYFVFHFVKVSNASVVSYDTRSNYAGQLDLSISSVKLQSMPFDRTRFLGPIASEGGNWRAGNYTICILYKNGLTTDDVAVFNWTPWQNNANLYSPNCDGKVPYQLKETYRSVNEYRPDGTLITNISDVLKTEILGPNHNSFDSYKYQSRVNWYAQDLSRYVGPEGLDIILSDNEPDYLTPAYDFKGLSLLSSIAATGAHQLFPEDPPVVVAPNLSSKDIQENIAGLTQEMRNLINLTRVRATEYFLRLPDHIGIHPYSTNMTDISEISQMLYLYDDLLIEIGQKNPEIDMSDNRRIIRLFITEVRPKESGGTNPDSAILEKMLTKARDDGGFMLFDVPAGASNTGNSATDKFKVHISSVVTFFSARIIAIPTNNGALDSPNSILPYDALPFTPPVGCSGRFAYFPELERQEYWRMMTLYKLEKSTASSPKPIMINNYGNCDYTHTDQGSIYKNKIIPLYKELKNVLNTKKTRLKRIFTSPQDNNTF